MNGDQIGQFLAYFVPDFVGQDGGHAVQFGGQPAFPARRAEQGIEAMLELLQDFGQDYIGEPVELVAGSSWNRGAAAASASSANGMLEAAGAAGNGAAASGRSASIGANYDFGQQRNPGVARKRVHTPSMTWCFNR